MTRKEIEMWCQKEMQQSIPNKDALWSRIESSLPEQPIQQMETKRSKRHVSVMYRTAAAAACFLFVAAGVSLWYTQRHLSVKNYCAPMENFCADNEAECQNNVLYENDQITKTAEPEKDEQYCEQDENEACGEENADADAPAAYVPHSAIAEKQNSAIADGTDRSRLKAEDADFSENAVLAKTDAFVEAIVTAGMQDQETGRMIYLLDVQNSFGNDDLSGVSLTLTTASPYLLELEHSYFLPLSMDADAEDGWSLVCDSAPQIEITWDEQIMFHDGWSSLMDGTQHPVLCEPGFAEDAYYDRMYATEYAALIHLLDGWALS